MTSIIHVARDPSGNENPSVKQEKKTPLDGSMEKKLAKFSQNFQVTPGTFSIRQSTDVTPNGRASRVPAKIPMITAPLTL